MKRRNARKKLSRKKMMRMENWMEKICGKVKDESQTESCKDESQTESCEDESQTESCKDESQTESCEDGEKE